jgi:AmmeMemoRadiSam system protein A
MTVPLALDDQQKAALLDVAARNIAEALATGAARAFVPDDLDPALRRPGASFVTLERGERLLGCIGSLDARDALARDVAQHALQAAFADPRLPAITVDDYVAMSIKVSVLSELEAIEVASFDETAAAIRPGVDGLVLESPHHRATFLPSVWPKLASAREFLAALWDKAGLVPGAWPAGTRILRYTTDEFASYGPRPAPAPLSRSG